MIQTYFSGHSVELSKGHGFVPFEDVVIPTNEVYKFVYLTSQSKQE